MKVFFYFIDYKNNLFNLFNLNFNLIFKKKLTATITTIKIINRIPTINKSIITIIQIVKNRPNQQ
jgi:hypothetical protein